MVDGDAIRLRWEGVGSKLDERGRRLFAAAEVRAAGWGGLALVSKITGLARSTINRGEDDLDGEPLPAGRVRREGGGRRAIGEKTPEMREQLRRLVDPATRGDPMRPLIWVSKSAKKLALALTSMGYRVGPDTVRAELSKLGFSRQGNRKADEGSKHPDRDAQFEYINASTVAAQGRGQPVVSVDTKKKELVGNFRNGGTDYRPRGDPLRVNVHDFEDKRLGKVAPYGVYDVTANEGWVSVGITADTAEFAVASLRHWFERMGRQRYPEADELTITADCGGSNGARVRLWKLELQKWADETGLTIHVRHYPPGTSKLEQDRAPAILSHHPELAGSSADRSPRRRRTDRRHDDRHRTEGRMRARSADLRKRRQSRRRRDGRSQPESRRLSPRVELLHQAKAIDQFVAVIVRSALNVTC